MRRGTRFTVIYRSKAAFQIIPVNEADQPAAPLADESLYRAQPVGRSMDGRTAAEHDLTLYSK